VSEPNLPVTMSEQSDSSDRLIAPLPRVAIQAFCETGGIADAIGSAASDRRMQKAHVKVQMGGAPAAVEAYRHSPTPNVIVLEFQGDRSGILGSLDQLSTVCDAGTKVLVIGHVNDVVLYRELMRRGVSEYLIAPSMRSASSRRPRSFSRRPVRSRSAARSRSRVPREASVPRRSPTTSPGQSPSRCPLKP
jgi:hypothetical protein